MVVDFYFTFTNTKENEPYIATLTYPEHANLNVYFKAPTTNGAEKISVTSFKLNGESSAEYVITYELKSVYTSVNDFTGNFIWTIESVWNIENPLKNKMNK